MNITMLGSGSWKSSLSYRIMALGRQLAPMGWKVTVIVPGADKYNQFQAESRPRDPDITVIQPWQLATSSATLNLLPYMVIAAVALLRSRADVVYLYKPTPITILGLLPRLLYGTSVVLDLDDLGSKVMQAEGRSRLQINLVSVCERLALRFSSTVVVASTYLEEYVRSAYPHKSILVLPNGVDIDAYRRRSAITPRPALYYFGAINRPDLIEPLLRAMPAVLQTEPAARLRILGGGSALENAKELVRELGLAKAVSFTGWIDMDKAARYTRFGDIGICYQPDTPTVRAASNMKVFQYMAMSSVPVVSRVGDLARYIASNTAGVAVAPDDPEALAEVLIDLLRDPDRRTSVAHAARQLAETTYSWTVLAQELSHFLGQLPARGRWWPRRRLS